MQELYQASFEYHCGLANLLVRKYRDGPISYRFKEHPAVKDAIEAMGIPHTEVDVILVNDISVDFGYQLRHNDHVGVFPVFAQIPHEVSIHLTPRTPSPPSFILDVHLGKLAKRLRFLGFDSHYRNDLDDVEILQQSYDLQRIILTRDLGILKHRNVVHGYLVRSDHVECQVREVLTRFQLFNLTKPFCRCMACNGLMESVNKADILEQLEPKTRQYFDLFHRCSGCGRLYWRGSHYEKISQWLSSLTDSC